MGAGRDPGPPLLAWGGRAQATLICAYVPETFPTPKVPAPYPPQALPKPAGAGGGRHGQSCLDHGFGKDSGCVCKHRVSPACAREVTVLSVSQMPKPRPREVRRLDRHSRTSGSPRPRGEDTCVGSVQVVLGHRPEEAPAAPVWVSEKVTSGLRPHGAESAWHLGGGQGLRPGAPR